MKRVVPFYLLVLLLGVENSQIFSSQLLHYSSELPKPQRRLNNFVLSNATNLRRVSFAQNPQSSSSMTSSPSTSSATPISPAIQTTSLTTHTNTPEIEIKHVEELREASDRGNLEASKKLADYYRTLGSLYKDDADFYYKRSRLQLFDSKTEEEIKTFENEVYAKKNGDQALLLAQYYGIEKDGIEKAKRFNPIKSHEFYLLASRLDSIPALWYIGLCYLDGSLFTPCDSQMAYKYFEDCAQPLCPKAFVMLSYLTKYGIGAIQNEEKAKQYMYASGTDVGRKQKASVSFQNLERNKRGFCDGMIYDCSKRCCLFEGHEWFFESQETPITCPCTFNKNENIFVCDCCKQAFHEQCIESWRKKYNIRPEEGCPNPKCRNFSRKLLNGLAL